jgi:signal transduction histidine kinase
MLHLKSIMSRILLLHVIAVVIAAIFMPLVLYRLLIADVESYQQHAKREQAESIAQHLTYAPGRGWSLNLPAGLQDRYSEAYGRYAYAVLDETGNVLFSPRKNRAAIFPVGNARSDIEFREATHGNRVLSGAQLRKDIDGHVAWIQVAEDLAHRDVVIDDIAANYFQQVAWIVVPILLLLLATDIVIFRRAVLPLLRASDRASHISMARIDVRLPVEDVPTEIRPLVVAINQALDRLEEGLRRQREFAADAAHELRTPLAVLRTRIETLPDKAVADSLHRDVEGMSRVIGQLLDAAELEIFVVDPGETTDLHEVCAEVAEFIAPLALAQGKSIELTGTEAAVWVSGNAEMLGRAIRNLVENALNHAPRGTNVEIVVGQEGTVSVLDQGEGVPAAKRELIFERFWRDDSRRTGGAGLGLSIVKRIVEAHRGSITVENRPGGGANFTLRFPLATQPASSESAIEDAQRAPSRAA